MEIVNRETVRRQALTMSTLASLKGCCGLFEPCTDADLMSLSFYGAEPFLDWLGWQPSIECDIRKGFITYVRPDDCADTGAVADPCADPDTVDFGTCKFLLHDFARLRRMGPTRDITEIDMRKCLNEPRWRLDGSMIDTEMEWDMWMITAVLLQDLRRMMITGNAATPAQFDGLQRLVRTGYVDPDGNPCSAMDANVINWNGNTLTGGAGITWNGTPQPNTANMIDFLQAVQRRVRQRMQWSGTLAAQQLMVGDMALVLPNSFIPCLLDSFTCWSVCPSTAMLVTQDNPESRAFRRTLDGGMFGFGRIWLNGQEIPLIGYDWNLINGPSTFDMYFLTTKVGSVQVFTGQYKDLRVASEKMADVFDVTDGGRLLTWKQTVNTCFRRLLEMRPRLLCWAPWAQTRFQDVRCAVLGGVLSPDPCESSFFSTTSFSTATCPST